MGHSCCNHWVRLLCYIHVTHPSRLVHLLFFLTTQHPPQPTFPCLFGIRVCEAASMLSFSRYFTYELTRR
ncbi:hypothetical protein BDQ17DRAFT_1342710 [Cyathus striatus]|nr:hypothetical protein BDQ17DRAFT_1364297 [Cyathus striatus]KAF9002085.1 hypothetical protein BDQ17DRAFT_1357423 [Cyathus striatus]KAF9013085.1 hypothetical protein BDQ17DRAFT_1342710 [Cyathus striatus]